MAKAWKPTPKQLSVLELFGIDYENEPDPSKWEVKFGIQYLPLQNQSDASPDGRYYATTERMIAHTGLLEDIYNDPEYLAILQARPNEWERRVAVAGSELERKVLAPLRRQMERRYFFSLYRSGSVEYAPDEKTGLVSIVAMGDPTVKVLPLSVQVAQMYGMDDATIKLIAKEAIYVLEKKKIAHRAVRSEDELLTFIDGWLAYIPDAKVRKRLHQSFKDKTPCIVGKKVTQLLLPGTR